MKNKKAQSKTIGYVAAILMFSLVIVGFYIIPNKQAGFWETYQYTPPSNELSSFDKSTEIDQTITNINCDIEDKSSCGTEQKNIFQKTTNFISSMVGGAYGGLITLTNSFSTSKTLILGVGEKLKIPNEIVAIFATLILAIITISVLFIIFNRSDSA